MVWCVKDKFTLFEICLYFVAGGKSNNSSDRESVERF